MRRYSSVDAVPVAPRGRAVTVGKFDGLHIGHRRLITRLEAEAANRGLPTLALTFDRHPAAVFRPECAPAPVTSIAQRVELLHTAGIDEVVVEPFTPAFAAMAPDTFLADVLAVRLQARLVVVGEDFSFGRGGTGDVALLERCGPALGYEVVVPRDVDGDGARKASSSWVRERLDAGDVDGAAALLGRPHAVRGEVVHGAQRGRALGFPTANLAASSEGYVPADGVYAGYLIVDGRRHPAAISVGDNPTFEGVPRKQIEAYALDEQFDLYGKVVTVEFLHRLRSMVKYAGPDALVRQLHDDVRATRAVLGLEEG